MPLPGVSSDRSSRRHGPNLPLVSGSSPDSSGTRPDSKAFRRNAAAEEIAPYGTLTRTMDLALILLIVAVLVAAGAIALRDPALLWLALGQSGKLLGGVWLDLLLGFVLAGLVEVLIPEATVLKWLGKQNVGYGVLAGWGLGLLVPGGPYVTFPIAANLFRQGAAPGPLIAL